MAHSKGRFNPFVLLILVCLLSVVSACQPVATSPTEAQTAEQPASSSENQEGTQVLRLVFEGGMGRGPVPGQDIGAATLPVQIFLPPFLMDGEGNLLPALATSVDANDDNTVFTLHIDPKATWSDGKPITAQDFVDWYNWVFHPDRGTSYAHYTFGAVQGLDEFLANEADSISGFKAVDEKTLEITLSAPQGWFPQRLAYPYAAPARADQYGDAITREEISAVWLKEKANDLIVSGPFKPTYLEPEPAAIYRWEQNPNWWGDQKPIITHIEGTTIRDFQTMLLMFENGQVDAALFLAGPPAVLLFQNQPEVFREMTAYRFYAQFFDITKPPTDDVDLRRALMSAVDWQQVSDVAWEGQMLAPNAGGLMPPTMPCYDTNYQPYPFDPVKAQEYLAQSKYGPTGATVPKIRILTADSDPPRIRAAQIIQEMWRTHLGIEDVEIKNAETEFLDGEGFVNVTVASGGAQLPIPALILEAVGHSLGNGAKFTQINNPDWDQRIDELMAADPEDAAYCGEVQAMLEEIQDQALVIPTAYIKDYFQVQPWLQNFEMSVSGWYTTMEAELTER
jgi:ABC-type transport system substrate-binding protein